MKDVAVPLIQRSLDAANVPLSGDVTYFHRNDVDTFRKLFHRELTRDEMQRWTTRDEDESTPKRSPRDDDTPRHR